MQKLLSRSTSFLSSMEILKHRDPWVTRICFTAILLGTYITWKFWLDLYPSMNLQYLLPTQLSKESSACQTFDSNFTVQSTNARSTIPNSFLPCEDYVNPGSSTYTLGDISQYFKTAVEDSELLHAAQAAARRPLAPGPPSVAFLFTLRGEIPLRPVWERFFTGIDPSNYSIYTHSSQSAEIFPNNSVFHNRSICSKDVARYSITLVDVVRRLLAFALLDTEKPNMWFTLVSESGAPIRSFSYIYDYFMKSNTSFVEAFSPTDGYRRWPTEPHFRRDQLRKGELWLSVHRRHAGMIVGDMLYYRKFKRDCAVECTLDEEYLQTFLSIKDSMGIANRTVMYVDWSPPHGSSPRKISVPNLNSEVIRKLQNMTENVHGQYMDTSDEWTHPKRSCVYNGQPQSPCFLFARKFETREEELKAFQDIPKEVLGY